MTQAEIEQPTLADILAAFHRFSEDTQRLHGEQKADRRAMEARIFGRLDDVLLRLGDYQKNVDTRFDNLYAELDALRRETTMRLQSVEARVTDLEQSSGG